MKSSLIFLFIHSLGSILNFSLRHHVQTASRAQRASHPMGIRGSFPEDKAAGAWSLPLSSV